MLAGLVLQRRLKCLRRVQDDSIKIKKELQVDREGYSGKTYRSPLLIDFEEIIETFKIGLRKRKTETKTKSVQHSCILINRVKSVGVTATMKIYYNFLDT